MGKLEAEIDVLKGEQGKNVRRRMGKLEAEIDVLKSKMAALKAEQKEMIDSQDRAVWKYALKFRRLNPHLELDDLRQEGYLGLIDGSLLYDARRGVRWNTYAFKCIWARIIRYAQDSTGQIRVPSNLVIKAWKGRLGKKEGDRGRKALSAMYGISSWSTWSKDDEGSPMQKLIAKEGRPALDYDEREYLMRLLNRLPERARNVVWWRVNGKTLAEIGAEYGVSKERARQIEQWGIDRMRALAEKSKKA